MDGWETLTVGIGTLILAIGGTGMYLLNRLKKLERKDEEAGEKVKAERDSLLQRVADLEEMVRTLKIKADRVDALQTQVDTMGRALKETQVRLDASEERSNNLQRENERLTQRNAELQASLTRLETEHAAYEKAFRLLGQRLDDKAGDDTLPESGAEASEMAGESAGREQSGG